MLQIPKLEQIRDEANLLVTQIDYDSACWKTFERWLEAERWILLHEHAMSTEAVTGKIAGKLALNDRLRNLAETTKREHQRGIARG